MSQGKPFGEAPVFTGQRFPAYAEALADTNTLFIPRDDFIHLIRSASLALGILSVLSLRLKRSPLLFKTVVREVPGARLSLVRERAQGRCGGPHS